MIREYKNSDLDSVMRIWLETNIKAHSFIAESYWRLNYNDVRRMIPCAEVYVFEANNAIAGFVGVVDHYIEGIFVDACSQSNGIGMKLLDYIKVRKSALTLGVYRKNVRAVKFYLRENFAVLKEQIEENTGEVELIMHWKTADS